MASERASKRLVHVKRAAAVRQQPQAQPVVARLHARVQRGRVVHHRVGERQDRQPLRHHAYAYALRANAPAAAAATAANTNANAATRHVHVVLEAARVAQ